MEVYTNTLAKLTTAEWVAIGVGIIAVISRLLVPFVNRWLQKRQKKDKVIDQSVKTEVKGGIMGNGVSVSSGDVSVDKSIGKKVETFTTKNSVSVNVNGNPITIYNFYFTNKESPLDKNIIADIVNEIIKKSRG